MSDDTEDLESIDVAHEQRATESGHWAPGWYADPWTAGQYRYWSGQAWTGETQRWGPAHAPHRPGSPTQPWPSAPTQTSTPARGYGWAGPPRPATPTPDRPPRRRGVVAGGVVALVVTILVAGAVGFAIEDHSRSSSNSSSPFVPGPILSPTTTPSGPTTTVPPSALSRDPQRSALAGIVVQQADVSPTRTVRLIPQGNLLNQPTLDLCNGTYPSERLRTARLQVADFDPNDQNATVFGTEAVLYRDAAAAAQALAELRTVTSSCPDHPVVSTVGDPTATTVFHAPPDAGWPNVPTVARQAYSLTTITEAQGSTPATSTDSVAVYLRRGRVLLGVYFSPPGTQPAVAGRRTMEGIVGVFAARVARLPASVVGAS